MDADGYVRVGVVAGFNRVRALTGDAHAVLRALRRSPGLEVRLSWAMRASIAARRAESAKGLGKADAAATTARPRAESAAHAALCCEVRTRDAPERWVTKGGAAPGGLASGGLKEQPHAATERAEQRAVRC